MPINMNKPFNGIYNKKGSLFLDTLEARGRRAFSLIEAQEQLGVLRKNAIEIIGNLRRQKRVIALTRGYYALWPPAQRKHGLNPLPIIDPLMRYRKISYYVGLLSAANRYGAAHHKPQVLQVILPKQLRFRRAHELGVSFHTNTHFPSRGLIKVKQPSGYIYFSSPELTALDVLYFQSQSGGFGNVSLVIQELIPHINMKNLMEVVESYPTMACIQRLGFMMDFFKGSHKILTSLHSWLSQHQTRVVTLLANGPRKGKLDKNWRVLLNTKIEVET
jgi:predicted transcriptional regulator of viral defense system